MSESITTAPPDPLIGELIAGRYRVMSLIGAGGMGSVYLAEHQAIQKRVALKVLHPEYSQRREIVERFQQEAISASRIKHPNVLEVFDYGELPSGSSYIAMELLEGRDLGAWLEHRGPLTPSMAIEVMLQVCRALEAAHARGVIHRDMKPDNVFLQEHQDGEWTVKIVDFGIARLREDESAAPSADAPRRRLTKTGMIFGTPEYMAPEQAQGREADARSDVYAAGVILFEALTAAVPFAGATFLEVLNKHVSQAVPRLRESNDAIVVSDALEAIVLKALVKDPAARFQSMRELADALLETPEAEGQRPSDRRSVVTPGTPLPSHLGAVTQVRGTPLVASATIEIPKRRSSMLWVLLGSALVVGGAATAWRMGALSSSTPTVAAATTPTAPPTPPPSATPPPPPVEEVAAPAPTAEPVEAPPAKVPLHVSTQPPGALVLLNGFQVCDSTPCDVLATPEDTLELTARLGNRSGTAKVLAQREQNVVIPLFAPRAARPSAPKATEPPKPQAPKLCEVVVDGLKILRECP